MEDKLKRRDYLADEFKHYAKQGFKLAGVIMILSYIFKDYTKHKIQREKRR